MLSIRTRSRQVSGCSESNENIGSDIPHCHSVGDLLIKTATSATFVVMIQGSSCLYAGPKYKTPPWKQGNGCIIATKRPARAKRSRACCVCCYLFQLSLPRVVFRLRGCRKRPVKEGNHKGTRSTKKRFSFPLRFKAFYLLRLPS